MLVKNVKRGKIKQKRQKRDKTSVILVVVVVRNSIVRYKICY